MRGPQCSARTRPRAALDRLAGREQRPRLERGLQQDHLVEVRRLLHPAERRGLLHGGRGDQPGAGQRRERGARRGEVLLRDRPDCCRARRTPVRAAATRSGLDREVPRDALEVGRRPRRARRMARSSSACPAAASSGAPRQRLGLAPGAGRACRHLFDLPGQPVRPRRAAPRPWRRWPARGGRPRRWCRRSRRAPARRRRSAPRRRPPPPVPAPSAPRPPTPGSRSPPAAPAPRRAAWRLCAARSRTSSATTAKPRPSRPARAASIAALSAMRLVRSAISRIVPMKPLIRLVSVAQRRHLVGARRRRTP